MDILFLLRSYGDFVIALTNFSKSSSVRKVQIIASIHLKPLYADLCSSGIISEMPFLRFKDFGIKYKILGCFTNKYLLSKNTLTELWQLRKFVNQLPDDGAHIYFEQSARILWPRLFTGYTHAGYVNDGITNIYKSYADFLETDSNIISPEDYRKGIAPLHILVTPGSRKSEKALPVDLVTSIVNYSTAKGHTILVSGLMAEIEKYDQPRSEYSNFRQLIQLVKEADFIISADSLPVHLAQLMGKPHYILYNRTVNHAWLTPFATTKSYYATFSDWERIKDSI